MAAADSDPRRQGLKAVEETLTEYLDVPMPVVQRIRAACGHLPEVHEEQAFAGFRLRIQ